MRVHEFIIRTDFQRNDLVSISHESSQFESDITITFSDDQIEHHVDVKSLLGMMLLPITSGTAVRLLTNGREEVDALYFVLDMFDNHL